MNWDLDLGLFLDDVYVGLHESLKSSSVDVGGAGAGVGFGPSVGAGDPRVNELDKLSSMGVELARVLPSMGAARS